MSTKTLRKRIALVAVSALGLGLMSVAPAQASNSYTSNITLSTTSLTVVGAANTGFYGFIPVNVTDPTLGTPAGLQATESITAVVTAWPTAVDSTTASTDLTLTVFKRDTASNNVFAAVSTGTTVGSGAGAAYGFDRRATDRN